MSRGVVDMTLNNWGFVGDFKVDQVTSHHLNVPLGAVAVGVVMRKDRYEALPAEARAAIDRFSGELLSKQIGQAFDAQQEEVLGKVQKSTRNTVVLPDEATVNSWKEAVTPVIDDWRKLDPKHESLYESFTANVKKVRSGG